MLAIKKVIQRQDVDILCELALTLVSRQQEQPCEIHVIQLEYKADANDNELAVPYEVLATRFPEASLKELLSARVAHRGRCHSLTKIWKLS